MRTARSLAMPQRPPEVRRSGRDRSIHSKRSSSVRRSISEVGFIAPERGLAPTPQSLQGTEMTMLTAGTKALQSILPSGVGPGDALLPAVTERAGGAGASSAGAAGA